MRDDGWDTGAVFLDIARAFDGVWTDGLVYKLIELRVPGAYRHSVLEQSTIVTLEGSDWTNESDVTLLHTASTVRHAYLVSSSSIFFYP
ncbi:hypothetical protein AVEN_270378-1 [Araneus ventricosus]|uniref:Reverse transcriptase domain-containing protein n=1 Tax=Araneus ventricosus TaxID=182803 RepID=A0A4Y2VAB1_ARAVE|nr:hypothetical protein AVEN_270378-1 [Araneus ventricosus]